MAGHPLSAEAVGRPGYPRRVTQSPSPQLVPYVERAPLDATPAAPTTSAAPVALAPVQLPRARRPSWPTLASLAIVSGLVALGLGAWAIVSGVDDDSGGLGDEHDPAHRACQHDPFGARCGEERKGSLELRAAEPARVVAERAP